MYIYIFVANLCIDDDDDLSDLHPLPAPPHPLHTRGGSVGGGEGTSQACFVYLSMYIQTYTPV